MRSSDSNVLSKKIAEHDRSQGNSGPRCPVQANRTRPSTHHSRLRRQTKKKKYIHIYLIPRASVVTKIYIRKILQIHIKL